MNLLKETKEILTEHGLTLNDIKWVGCVKFRIPIEQFINLANDNYDDGFGAAEVAEDLIVVGNDWWLERKEYDGAEWWEFKQYPKMPEDIKQIKRVMGGMWDTLEDININQKEDV